MRKLYLILFKWLGFKLGLGYLFDDRILKLTVDTRILRKGSWYSLYASVKNGGLEKMSIEEIAIFNKPLKTKDIRKLRKVMGEHYQLKS